MLLVEAMQNDLMQIQSENIIFRLVSEIGSMEPGSTTFLPTRADLDNCGARHICYRLEGSRDEESHVDINLAFERK